MVEYLIASHHPYELVSLFGLDSLLLTPGDLVTLKNFSAETNKLVGMIIGMREAELFDESFQPVKNIATVWWSDV